MAGKGLSIKIELDPIQVGKLVRELPQQTEKAINVGVDRLLVFIENVQILKYTATSDPPALRYRRTFRLQRASRKQRTGRKLPEISGEWYVDPQAVDYGEDVLGERARQSSIHQGRWKSLEEVAEEAEAAWPEIIEDELSVLEQL